MNQVSNYAAVIVHRLHFLERATAHSFSWAHTAHSVAQDKVVSVSFIVIPRAHSHPVSLMSLLRQVHSNPVAPLFTQFQRHFRAAQEVGVKPEAHPLVTEGSLLVAWPIPPQTQVMSPSRELNFVHALRDRDNLQKTFWTESWLGHSGRARGSAQIVSGRGGDWGKELGKAKSGSFFSGDQ